MVVRRRCQNEKGKIPILREAHCLLEKPTEAPSDSRDKEGTEEGKVSGLCHFGNLVDPSLI